MVSVGVSVLFAALALLAPATDARASDPTRIMAVNQAAKHWYLFRHSYRNRTARGDVGSCWCYSYSFQNPTRPGNHWIGTYGNEAAAIAAYNRAIKAPDTCSSCRQPIRHRVRPPIHRIDGDWAWEVRCPQGRWTGSMRLGTPGSARPGSWSPQGGGGTMRSVSADGASLVLVRGLPRSQGGDQTWYGTIRNADLVTGTLGAPHQRCSFSLVRPRSKPVVRPPVKPPDSGRKPVTPPVTPGPCDSGQGLFGAPPSHDGLNCR